MILFSLVFAASLLGADVVRLTGAPVIKGDLIHYNMSDGSTLTFKRLKGSAGERFEVELSNSVRHGTIVLLNIDGNPLMSGHRQASISFSRIDSAIIDGDVISVILASPSSLYLLRMGMGLASSNELELHYISPRIESYHDIDHLFELVDLFTIRHTAKNISTQAKEVHHYFVREDGVQWLDGVLYQLWRVPSIPFKRQPDGTMILDDPFAKENPFVGGVIADNEPMKPLGWHASKTTAAKSAGKQAEGDVATSHANSESQSKWLWLLIGATLAIAWLWVKRGAIFKH